MKSAGLVEGSEGKKHEGQSDAKWLAMVSVALGLCVFSVLWIVIVPEGWGSGGICGW